MEPRGQYDATGKLVEFRAVTVPVSGGAGSATVTFGASFPRPPHVSVIPHETDEAAGAFYTATSVTRTGFTLSIVDSSYPDGDVIVRVMAAEKS